MKAPEAETELNCNLSILERVANDDQSAVEDCVKTYGNLVWKIARKYTNNNEDAEDVVQEIFTSIWLNAHRFDAAKSPESAFICLLAKRRAIDIFRKHRHQLSETELSETTVATDAKRDDHKNILLAMDLKTIRQALGKLSATENEMIRLSVYGWNSHNEIAERLNVPLGTVKSKIRRGVSKIKKTVGKPFLTEMRKAYYGSIGFVINSIYFSMF